MTTGENQEPKVLAVLLARAGSKGFPGKNIHSFIDSPLLTWSLNFAESSPAVGNVILSSDSQEYLDLGGAYSKCIPHLRSPEMSGDSVSSIESLQDAVKSIMGSHPTLSDLNYILLLDATSPFRRNSWLEDMIQHLESSPEISGSITVSKPFFNPAWLTVEMDARGKLKRLISKLSSARSRQSAGAFYRINGSLFLWKTNFVMSVRDPWLEAGHHHGYLIPEIAAHSFDTLEELQIAETLYRTGLIPKDLLNYTEIKE